MSCSYILSLLCLFLQSIQTRGLFWKKVRQPFGSTQHLVITQRVNTDILSYFRGGSNERKDDLSNDPRTDGGPCIGIDLGTTYSCVAVWKHGRIEICPNEQGNRITPSYVAFLDDGTVLVGDAAKNQAGQNPMKTIFDVKRFIGRKFEHASVQQDKTFMPFIIQPSHHNGTLEIVIENFERQGSNKTFTPEEISTMILEKMKQTAELYLGQKVKRAVVTVPAFFNDAQRRATRDAGIRAGLHIERIMNEPTAAAISYGLDKLPDKETILVFDLGGGTFDVTLLTIDQGIFKVRATAGDTHLGGEDFDQRMMEYFIEKFKEKSGIDISHDKRALQRLRKQCEVAKRTLSSQTTATVDCDALSQGVDFTCPITRAKFEELNMDLFKKTLKPVTQVLKDADVPKEAVDQIIMVGGSTRIPMIQTLLSEFFDGKELNKSIHPDEAVAYGAALLGAILSGDETAATKDIVMLLDVTPLSLGIQIQGGIMSTIIPRGTPIPVEMSSNFTTVYDNQSVVCLKVFQGERSVTWFNELLGEFEFSGIPPAAAGDATICVTLQIDVDGIVSVSATDINTGLLKTLKIDKENDGISEAEIDRVIYEAEEFTDLDEALCEWLEADTALSKSLRAFNKFLSGRYKGKWNEQIAGAIINSTMALIAPLLEDSGDEQEGKDTLPQLTRTTHSILSKSFPSYPKNSSFYSAPALYDLASSFRNFREEVRFLLWVQSNMGQTASSPKGYRILELAAGPARHSITALKSFSQVATCTALDTSHDMMEYSLGLAEDEVHNKSFTYVLDDMRYMTSIAATIANEPYDAVWLLFWSIQHLLTHEDALHCFQSTYRLLHSGGLFILQIAPPGGLYAERTDRNEIPLYDQHGNDCGLLTLVNGHEDDEIDDILQICNMTWSIEWNDFEKHTNVINRDMRRSSESAEGEDIQEEASRSLKEIVPCRYFTLQEIYALAKLSGFEVVGTFGELDEDVDIHVESATRHMVCVLRKQVTS